MTYLFPEKTIRGLEDWRSIRSLFIRFGIFIIAAFILVFIILVSSQIRFKTTYDIQGILLIVVAPLILTVVIAIICYLRMFKAEEYAQLSIVFKGDDSVENTEIAVQNALKTSNINASTSLTDDRLEAGWYDRSYEPEDDDWTIKIHLGYGNKSTTSYYIRIGPINEKNEKEIIGFMKELTNTLEELKLL
jgi:hypothetical protein